MVLKLCRALSTRGGTLRHPVVTSQERFGGRRAYSSHFRLCKAGDASLVDTADAPHDLGCGSPLPSGCRALAFSATAVSHVFILDT
jgi:hypothetical protein